VKRTAPNDINGGDEPLPKIRRIQPTKVADLEVTTKKDPLDVNGGANEDIKDDSDETKNTIDESKEEDNEEETDEAGPSTSKDNSGSQQRKNEITEPFKVLIKTCFKAESSSDMKQVVKKLFRYYHQNHSKYITSKAFLKSVKNVTEEIVKEPHLVYKKLTEIIHELDARRKGKTVEVEEKEESKLSEEEEVRYNVLKKAFKRCKRAIADLEEAEVDWEDDDNSAYLKKFRFEKRACEIYEKMCEITGESKHAHRLIKKPIKFKGTDFPEFNKHLERTCNKKNAFPNYRSVLKTLDFCNKKYKYGLSPDQMKRVAQDGFEKLGKILQQRRKTDLYETTEFYVGKEKDPAKTDPELQAQLEKNKKNYAKYDVIINE
jgi:death-associated protein 6